MKRDNKSRCAVPFFLVALVFLTVVLLIAGCREKPPVPQPPAPTPSVETCEHVYADECEATVCQKCGAQREAPGHDFRKIPGSATLVEKATCQHPATYHAVCRKCRAQGEVFSSGALGEHTYKSDCDTVCGVCGTSRTSDTAHDFDDHNLCRLCGHKATQSECPHRFAGGCGTVCERCGLIREITHEYVHDCDSRCRYCGEETRPSANHRDIDADGVCDDCRLPLGKEPEPGIPPEEDPVWF